MRQDAFVINIQSAAIIEDKSLTRANCACYIQLEFWFGGADSEIAFFSQTHLLFVTAAEEIANTEGESATATDNLPVSTVVRNDCSGLIFVLTQHNCLRLLC